MADLSIDLVTPGGMVLEATILPDDMLTEDVISELVDELSLPRVAPDGAIIPYSLEVAETSTVLTSGQTLREAKISSGDRLRMTTSGAAAALATKPSPRPAQKPVPVAPPVPSSSNPAMAPTATLANGTIEVVLSVLDLNRSEKTQLDPSRSIGDLLKQIAATFDLPARDKLNEPINYRLESKALGRYLANRETLAAAGVPRLDRLTVHREEIAGAVDIPVRP